MELFAPLLCEQAKKALVKKLKSLQEEMGAYNDRCMQLQMLRDFEATEGADKKAKKAVKLLIQSIKRAQLEARKSIERSSNAFFGEKTQQLLHLITQ